MIQIVLRLLQVTKHPVSVRGLSSPSEETPPDRGRGLNLQNPASNAKR